MIVDSTFNERFLRVFTKLSNDMQVDYANEAL